MKRFTYKMKLLFLLFSIAAFLISCTDTEEADIRGRLSVHFIDVGQGDATLVIAPNGDAMLIDAGDNFSGEGVVSYIRSRGVKKLEVLVGTHPDSDHVGGVDDVIRGFDVGRFYMPRKSHTTRTFKDVLVAAKDKGLKISEAKAGEQFTLGDDVKCRILSPSRDYGDNNNKWSAVLRIEYKDKSFLFMGDAEAQNEMEIIASGQKIGSNVLKVGHHGSSSSSTPEFIDAVSPDVAVVSCGMGNGYSHPHKEVLTLLESKGIKLYRTDEQGSIVFLSDGSRVWSMKAPGSYEYYGEVE